MSLSVGKRRLEENCDEITIEFKRICPNFGQDIYSNGLSSDAEISEDNSYGKHQETSENKTSSQFPTVCFSCESEAGDMTKCTVESCDKYYHIKCLKKHPSLKSEKNACPHHLCLSCHLKNPKNSQNSKGEMLKCVRCPTAFHAKEECFIPGSVALYDNAVTCQVHFSPENLRGYSRVVNLCFCVLCGCNDDLVFCSSCPCAIHKKCLKAGVFTDDTFICDRCKSRKTICYNDIVWAKVYSLRWWPAKVLDPKDVPAYVRKMEHFDGEFPVQFFETDEYFWTQTGRVYPFISKQVGIEDKDLRHNSRKTLSDSVFDSALQLACQALTDKRSTVSTETSGRKKYPPYKHVKCNKPVGNVQLYTSHDISDYNPCGCSARDPDPCGYDSLCLNRSMCTECNADVCEASELCQNRKFQRTENAKVKPFLTTTKAWGLKCLENIKEGHFVIEYCGDLIDEEECERRIKQKNEVGDTNFYFCTLDSNRIIDAGPKGNFSRFMNHSCEPNCETQKWIVHGDVRVGIFAKQDIPAGSELTFDYQMDFSHYKKLKCNCGSKRCSGLIGKKPQNGVMRVSDDGESSEPPSSASDTKTSTKLNKISKKINGSLSKNSPKTNGVNKQSKKELSSIKNSLKKEIGASKNLPKANGVNKQSKKELSSIKNSLKKEIGVSKNLPKVNGVNKQSKKELSSLKNSLKKEIDMKKEPVKGTKDHKKDKILCFKCKSGGKLLHCSLEECGRYFHVRCLKPGMETYQTDDWECPSHFCENCKMLASYQCFSCPNSYCRKHVTDIPVSGKFACPKHFKEKQ